jgi:hypothetical protein
MDDIPKGATGKPIRVKLSERFGMDAINDHSPKHQRIFAAKCPPPGAKISTKIQLSPYDVSK